MNDKPTMSGAEPVEPGVSSVWGELAPLSVGAVASGAVIVGASALLRRALGPRARFLSWASTIALLPFGLWLLTRGGEEEAPEPAAGVEELPSPGEARELKEPEN